MDPLRIDEEWHAALADAGLSPEAFVVEMTDQQPKDAGRGAQWWRPGMRIDADEHLVSEELSRALNVPEQLRLHRVVIRRPLTDDPVAAAAFAGKLRHELEHARQWEACGDPPFALNTLADSVLARKVAGLPSGRVFTNLKPVEQDANAAAATYLRARWPDAVAALLDDPADAPLARSLTPPASPESLVNRMVAFLYLYEDLCAALEASWSIGYGFPEYLDAIAPGAGALWRTLQTPLDAALERAAGRQSADSAWEDA